MNSTLLFSINPDIADAGWKQVLGFSSYSVHPTGKVLSRCHRTPVLLRGISSGRGYRAVTLKSDDDALRRIYVHRLIAITFLPIDPTRPHVNHKDGNKLNNEVSNLEWCTNAENLQHARETGLSRVDGENNPMAWITTAQVEQIRELRNQGLSYSKIAREIGCSIMQANRIARGLLRRNG